MLSSSTGHGGSSGKNLERLISRRALQAGGSAPCKTWVLGFLCGVCTVYLLGAALPPVIQIPLIQPVYPPLRRSILRNSSLPRHGNPCTYEHFYCTVLLSPSPVFLQPWHGHVFGTCFSQNCIYLFGCPLCLTTFEQMELLQHMAQFYCNKRQGQPE
jgi:hypothetical protein